jgi:hypothetical protein
VRTQDEAFKLLGLVWSRAPNADVMRQRDRVLALQRADGGWAQRPTMNPDAYQTGQVLYALHESGFHGNESRVPAWSPVSAQDTTRGRHLVRPVARICLSAVFRDRFSARRSQFISAAATSWAVVALAYSMKSAICNLQPEV